MAVTKKATKKAVKKTATKKAAAPKKASGIKLKDDTLYVLSVRDKLFFWKPVQVFETAQEANHARIAYENTSPLAFAAAKVDRVKLVQG